MQARVGPLVPVRIGNIQLCDGDGVDLVVLLGYSALDRLLILIGQDRRHLLLLDGVQPSQRSTGAGLLGVERMAAAATAVGSGRGRIARAAGAGAGAGAGADAAGGRRERAYIQAAAHDDARGASSQASGASSRTYMYTPGRHQVRYCSCDTHRANTSPAIHRHLPVRLVRTMPVSTCRFTRSPR